MTRTQPSRSPSPRPRPLLAIAFPPIDLLDDDRPIVDHADGGIDIRVDWDGGAGSGSFEALSDSSWLAFDHIEPGVLNVQAVAPSDVASVRIQRGPGYSGVPFKVRLIPIEWKTSLTMPDDHDVVVERGEDYEYKDGIDPETVSWVDSAASSGVHQLVLEDLEVGQDYELWIRLRHPTNEEAWTDQDPIIRTDGSNPPPP